MLGSNIRLPGSCDLFDGTQSAPPRIARRSDPATSKQAACDYSAGGLELDKVTLLDIIAKNPGHTASEYSVILKNQGVDWFKAARMTTKRISDLVADSKIVVGRVRTCEKTGKKARTYFANSDYL